MFTVGMCDCVKVIFIISNDKTLAVCLLTVRVTVLRYYLYGNMTGL